VQSHGLDDQGVVIQFSARARDLFLIPSIQTGLALTQPYIQLVLRALALVIKQWREYESGQSLSCSSSIENESSYTFTLPCLHGMHIKMAKFKYFQELHEQTKIVFTPK
jgi:hypothetical protein